jgi:hypothetical protein
MLGCADEPLEPTNSVSGPQSAALVSPEPALHAKHRQLIQLLARALAKPALRAKVHKAMQSSPYKEHKLQFRRFLERDGLDVKLAMAQLGGRSSSEILADLDRLPPFEFYMPVREHRAAWTGGANVIVVGRLEEWETPMGFDLSGAPVAGLSAAAPPATPVLVVVPAETRFDEDRGPGPAIKPAFAVANPSPTSPWDFRLAQVNIGKSYEPWTSGEPEFEMHIYASNASGAPLKDANGNYRFWDCIGEDIYPATPANGYWNYDAWGAYRTYTGTARPVLATDTNQNSWMDGQLHLLVSEDDLIGCGEGGNAGFPQIGDIVTGPMISDDRVLLYSMPLGLRSVYVQYTQGVNLVSINFGLRANLN